MKKFKVFAFSVIILLFETYIVFKIFESIQFNLILASNSLFLCFFLLFFMALKNKLKSRLTRVKHKVIKLLKSPIDIATCDTNDVAVTVKLLPAPVRMVRLVSKKYKNSQIFIFVFIYFISFKNFSNEKIVYFRNMCNSKLW